MPTIRDVADLAGVSVATVSYVLNNGPRTVKESTRLRVRDALATLNYHPSAVARGLQGKRMNTIGVVIPYSPFSLISDEYSALILEGIVGRAISLNQTVMLFAGDVWANPTYSLPIFGDGRCDGLIMLVTPTAEEAISEIVHARIPLVVIGKRTSHTAVSSIEVNFPLAMSLVIEHLAEFGHRKLTYFSADDETDQSNKRISDVIRAVENLALNPDECTVVRGEESHQSGYERCRELLKQSPERKSKAIVCASDTIALGVLAALNEKGIFVPDEISVTGVGDIALAKSSHPPLTTVSHALIEQGSQAVAMIVESVTSSQYPVSKWLQTPALVVRHSTGPVNQD